MPDSNIRRLDLSIGKMVGSKVIPTPIVLQEDGPRIVIGFGVHMGLAEVRRKAGKPVAAPVPSLAIIDSGATVTTIDKSIATALNLPQTAPANAIGIGGMSTGFSTSCVVHIKGLNINLVGAHCLDLSALAPITALIGRDILRFLVFHYDGINGSAYLERPQHATGSHSLKRVRQKGKRR